MSLYEGTSLSVGMSAAFQSRFPQTAMTSGASNEQISDHDHDPKRDLHVCGSPSPDSLNWHRLSTTHMHRHPPPTDNQKEKCCDSFFA